MPVYPDAIQTAKTDRLSYSQFMTVLYLSQVHLQLCECLTVSR